MSVAQALMQDLQVTAPHTGLADEVIDSLAITSFIQMSNHVDMTHSLRIIFAGTPQFAAAALAAIHAAGFTIPLVMTQPDRPAGRNLKPAASPVKQFALARGLPLIQPASLRCNSRFPDDAADAAIAISRLHATPHDVMVVAAYGLILPQAVLDMSPYGGINIHASLLPRWRGAAPIQRALEAGDTHTGISLIQMDAGLDTGPILSCSSVLIDPSDTSATLHDKLAALGAQLIVECLNALETNRNLPMTVQPMEGVTYAHKINQRETWLDWRRPANILAQQVRAFHPSPGSRVMLGDIPLKIGIAYSLNVSLSAGYTPTMPGTIIQITSEAVTVTCGEGALVITQWQKPGGKKLTAREFLLGFPLHVGQRFTMVEQIIVD